MKYEDNMMEYKKGGFQASVCEIGKIKTVLSSVPWICLSATLTSNVATYIHRVLRLKEFTMRLECPIHRDNINTLRI